MSRIIPYRYKSIPRPEAELYNRLFQKDPGLAFQLGADIYVIRFEPDSSDALQSPMTADVSMTERIRFELNLEEKLLAMMLTDIVSVEDLKTLPEIIRGVAFEVAMEGLLDRIDKFSGSCSTIGRMSEIRDAGQMAMSFNFCLLRKKDGQQGRGSIHTDAAGMAWIAGRVGRLPAKNLRNFNCLPVTGRIEIGFAELSIKEISRLEPCCIVLAEGAGAPDNLEVRICFNPGLALAGNLVQPDRVLVQDVITDKRKLKKMVVADENTIGRVDLPVDDIPVKLVFEIGRTDILLGELRQLQPGYTFKMDEPLEIRKPVTIKANGVSVGMGEIVQIDDRIGVRILEFNDNSHPVVK